MNFKFLKKSLFKFLSLTLLAAILILFELGDIYAATEKKIAVWAFWKQEWLQPGIDAFKEKYPDYEVDYQQLSWNNGKDKITTAIAGGMSLDVIQLGSTWLAEFISYDALAELADSSSAILDEYTAGFESAIKKGKIYGLPFYGSVNVIYYNKDLFEQAGIKHTPKTWEELEEASTKIKNLGQDKFGYSIKISGKIVTWQKFIPFLWSNGGKVIDENADTVFINSNECREAFEFYKRLSKTSFIATQDSIRQAFYLGRIGMILDGPGLDLEKKAPKLNAGFFLIPDVNSQKKGVGFTGADYLSVAKQSKNRVMAYELARFLCEYQLISRKISTLPPFNKKNSVEYLKKYPEGKFYIAQLASSQWPPVFKKWENLMEVLNYGVEGVVLNKKDIPSALADAKKEMSEIIAAEKPSGIKININVIIAIIVAISIGFCAWLIIKIRNAVVINLLSPWIISFILLSLYPVLFSIVVSFTDYNTLQPQSTFFTGIKNYIEIFSDEHFITASKNTIWFSLITIPLTTLIALLTAVFLNENIVLKKFFRASYFFPVITSIIVVAMIFTYMYSTFGPLNALLKFFKIKEIDFLNNPDSPLEFIIKYLEIKTTYYLNVWNVPFNTFLLTLIKSFLDFFRYLSFPLLSVALMSVWAGFGYYMLLFLAALQSIPEELYESSSLDGANSRQNFFYITLPQLKPMVMFVIVVCTIRTLQVFSEMFVMTGGGPLERTNTVVYYLYDYGFSKFQMGYASAAAYILFFVIFVLSILQMKILKE